MDAPSPDSARGELETFAAAVAHELRTPLSALSGEVELALRHERSPAAYREALSRIAVSVGELIDLTGDLSFLGDTSGAKDVAARTARLDRILGEVAARYRTTPHDVLLVELSGTDVAVAGDERLLARALTLVLDHAVRVRCHGSRVRMRASAPAGVGATSGLVQLTVDAAPGGFLPHAWLFLLAAGDEAASVRRSLPGPLRLRTAERIVLDCGGSMDVATMDAAHVVQIRLRCAEVA